MLYFFPDVRCVFKNVCNCLCTQDILLPRDIVTHQKLPGPFVSVSHVRALLDPVLLCDASIPQCHCLAHKIFK